MKRALLLLATLPGVALAAGDEIEKLAANRGCDICHMTLPRTKDARTPPAPSYGDIARRYRGRPGAEERLVSSILQGSGGAGGRHWAGKARFERMPANVVDVTELDARKLARWILR
jgi:cytochrome c551/c552